MNVLGFLDARAKRRQRRWELRLLEKAQRRAAGHSFGDTLLAFGMDAKFLIAMSVIGMFAWAYASNTDDDTMKGALIAGFAGAWGFYLGSSNSAVERRRSEGKAQDTASQAVDTANRAINALTSGGSAGQAADDVANAASNRRDEIKGDT